MARLRRLRVKPLYLALIVLTIFVVCDHPGRRVLLQYRLVMAENDLAASADTAGELVFVSDPQIIASRGDDDRWSCSKYASPEGETTLYLTKTVVEENVRRFDSAVDGVDRWSLLRKMPTLNSSSGVSVFGGGTSGGSPYVETIRHSRLPLEFFHQVEVYAHSRTALGSTDRLVIVKLLINHEEDLHSILIGYDVYDRLKLLEARLRLLCSDVATVPGRAGMSRELVFVPGDPTRGIRIYAFQSDLADLSRFTFDYEVDEQRGTVEGRLQANDTVRFNVLTGPAANPHWHEEDLHPTDSEG